MQHRRNLVLLVLEGAGVSYIHVQYCGWSLYILVYFHITNHCNNLIVVTSMRCFTNIIHDIFTFQFCN